MSLELEHEMFSATQIEAVAVIRFKGNLPVFLELENQILLEAIASERFRKRLNKHLTV
jgi:hypothetical protein